MKQVCLFLSAILLFVLSANSQAPTLVKINGKVTSNGNPAPLLTGTMINFMSFKMGEGYYNARVDTNGAFSFAVSIKQTVLYELKYGNYKLQVLLCPTEPEVKIEIDADTIEVRSLKVVGSHEYDAYRELKRIDKGFKDKLPTLLSGCTNKEKDCLKKLKKESEEFNASLQYLHQAYKGTFAAEVLAPMDEMPEINTSTPAITQLREHFFDKADLSNPNVYVTSDMGKNLGTYVELIADTTAKGRISFINAMNNKAQGNKDGQKELLSLFLTNFMDVNREDYLESLAHWAAEHPNLGEEQPVLGMKLKLLGKTVPGAPASPMSGTDVNDQKQQLLDVVKNNKLTLLIFWASDCPHCRATMPEIVKMYDEYHPKGLEIFAVSLEYLKPKWKEFLAEKKFGWKNVIIAQNDPSPNDYFLQYTPTFALIDQNGIIRHRFLSVADLNKSIGEILKK